MSEPLEAPEAGLHPAELEMRHYVRGTLSTGHAAAVLAHCLVCAECALRLTLALAGRPAGGVERECVGESRSRAQEQGA